MSSATTPKPQGVQDLIDRIRDEGVRAAREEAERIVKEAERKAATLVAEARREADELRAKAHEDIEAERAAAQEALKLSARDTILQLEREVVSAFERFVRRLVTRATCDECFIRDLVLVLAGRAVEEFIHDKEIQIFISEAILTGKSDEKLREIGKQTILSLSSDMLREGVELIPASDIQAGARVRLVDEQLEIDLSDEAVARLLGERLLPRFRNILEGIE
ncbi:V/A-type H+/Na+-transporting ATPase subunit E [Methylomarinovum tepidoasis]|uniref:V/A-type H+/Na+-transporting ATPase subunit E n=1 Tax=Methylomarinovum tepidoasis TaxID=2840183 RepID=A0AAU9CEC6_9GAMM|nr:hypothetical protein [Methylomarinovum sp. IN45]BCX88568.1 V/A-type H+/Na+-transporting ATPase subunit E [Methylomarinovum sp. IN45]